MTTPNTIRWDSPDTDFRLQVAGTLINHVMTQQYGLRCTYHSSTTALTKEIRRSFRVSPHKDDTLHAKYNHCFPIYCHTARRLDPATGKPEEVAALGGVGSKIRLSWATANMPTRAVEMATAWEKRRVSGANPREHGWVTNGLAHYVAFKAALGSDPGDLTRCRYHPCELGRWTLRVPLAPNTYAMDPVAVHYTASMDQLVSVARLAETFPDRVTDVKIPAYGFMSTALVDAIHGWFKEGPPIDQEEEARAFIHKWGDAEDRQRLALIDAERDIIDAATTVTKHLIK